MANDELTRWFRDLPFKARRELAKSLQEIGQDLVNEIRAAAPSGETGRLRDSVRMRRTRNTMLVEVVAGGAETEKAVGARTYDRRIRIGTDEDTTGAGKGTKAVTYDYALGLEYGNSHMPAHPFFYTTFNAKRGELNERLNQAVGDFVGNLKF